MHPLLPESTFHFLDFSWILLTSMQNGLILERMNIHNADLNVGNGFANHVHEGEDVYEFHYFHDGYGIFVNDAHSYHVRPGAVYLSRPDQNHQSYTEKEDQLMVIYSVSFGVDKEEETFMKPLRGIFEKNDGEELLGKGLGLFFEDLRRKKNSGNENLKIAAEHKLIAFIYELISTTAAWTSTRTTSYIDEALSVMQSSLTQSLNMDALITKLGIDKSYFIRLFKKTMGIPPLRYYMELKMEAARTSLRITDKSIRQISEELGYKDEFYFSRVFKEFTGLAPLLYRQGNRMKK